MSEVYNCALIAILAGFLPFFSLNAVDVFQTDSVAPIDTAFITARREVQEDDYGTFGLDSFTLTWGKCNIVSL